MQTTIIENARVLDTLSGRIGEMRALVIEGDRIADVLAEPHNHIKFIMKAGNIVRELEA